MAKRQQMGNKLHEPTLEEIKKTLEQSGYELNKKYFL